MAIVAIGCAFTIQSPSFAYAAFETRLARKPARLLSLSTLDGHIILTRRTAPEVLAAFQ
jgi:hypothetical protein